MKKESLLLEVSASIGKVSAECIAPPKSICVMTLAHGAGAGMDHSFMVTLAESLAALGVATLRFNFPFAENKKGRPDMPPVAHRTIEAAIQQAHNLFPSLPVFVSGKSFGGRMTSQYVSLHPDADVKGIIFFGFPLHPPKKPATDRADHLKMVTVPMLFLQGTRDELATLDLIESVCASLPLATLQKIEGADHAFKAGKKDIMQVLVQSTTEWVSKLI